MNTEICTPILSVRVSREPSDVRDALACRSLAFGRSKNKRLADGDHFDDRWQHILARDIQSGKVIGCARVENHATGSDLLRGYSAQYYDLSRLAQLEQPILELGRFCVLPDVQSADVIRLIWAAVAQMTDRNGNKMLVGCSSFKGVDPKQHMDAFGLLGTSHAGPEKWAPMAKSDEIFRMPNSVVPTQSPINAHRKMPPLIRSYLAMGGWVSDHGVIDRQMSTIHVFTGLEVANIPARRAARLRSIAA